CCARPTASTMRHSPATSRASATAATPRSPRTATSLRPSTGYLPT
ncbi:MAG: hypothetical protein AVDCRST_MAG54-2695, partial [uncultured Actinomycetospora sp.]